MKKPPRELIRRFLKIAKVKFERKFGPLRPLFISDKALLRKLNAPSIDALWNRLGEAEYCANAGSVDRPLYDRLCPGDAARILEAASSAIERKIDLLGSGPILYGEKIDWVQDYKTSITWPMQLSADIEYMNLDRPSDVKMPWEVSRMQWLIPLGQAYKLSGDGKYATAAREIVEDWIDSNHYMMGVNWAIAMEASMRVFTWTWLFHIFYQSSAWHDAGFQAKFLKSLYLHGVFIENNLERYEINGNHYLSNSAGLVFAGLFFGKGKAPARWLEKGAAILSEEMEAQVYPDGVDYEASIPYHRLVTELFLYPAIYMEKMGVKAPANVVSGIKSMARFIQAYIKPDGQCPLLGDADDARVLPFGGQAINDHRYLPAIYGIFFSEPEFIKTFTGSASEIFWMLGEDAAASAISEGGSSATPSEGFAHGGMYIMRNANSQVFIDCGPVGLRGYGGHGHNDCLSIEVVLDSAPLITDAGSYVYTASCEWHNMFRGTNFHNTPMIDGEEINRFVDPLLLWNLHNDAIPEHIRWEPGKTTDFFRGSHRGYLRLKEPVRPVRTIALDKDRNWLCVGDKFEGRGLHKTTINYLLAPGVTVTGDCKSGLILDVGSKRFQFEIDGSDAWKTSVGRGWVSPSYGIKIETTRIELSMEGPLAPVTVAIAPSPVKRHDLLEWACKMIAL